MKLRHLHPVLPCKRRSSSKRRPCEHAEGVRVSHTGFAASDLDLLPVCSRAFLLAVGLVLGAGRIYRGRKNYY